MQPCLRETQANSVPNHIVGCEEVEETKSNTEASFDLIPQRRILYYSDFDIDVSDWKEEKEKLKVFSSTLLDQLCKFFN